MKVSIFFVFAALTGLAFQNYKLQEQQNVIYDIALKNEAHRAEVEDRLALTPADRKQAYIDAIKILKKDISSHSRADKALLTYSLGTIFYTRHREELEQLFPNNQTQADKILKELEEKVEHE
jgi:ribosomal protein L31E